MARVGGMKLGSRMRQWDIAYAFGAICLGLHYYVSSAHMFYNSLSYACCITVAMVIGAKLARHSRFSFKNLAPDRRRESQAV